MIAFDKIIIVAPRDLNENCKKLNEFFTVFNCVI